MSEQSRVLHNWKSFARATCLRGRRIRGDDMTKTTHTYKFKKGEVVTCGEIYLLKDFPTDKPWFEWSAGTCLDAEITRDINFTITIEES